jgi:hypothetical protein
MCKECTCMEINRSIWQSRGCRLINLDRLYLYVLLYCTTYCTTILYYALYLSLHIEQSWTEWDRWVLCGWVVVVVSGRVETHPR